MIHVIPDPHVAIWDVPVGALEGQRPGCEAPSALTVTGQGSSQQGLDMDCELDK